MSVPLRALIVEDSENDALLIIDELYTGGFDPTFERVETREAMQMALARQEWDIIIADYRLPSFSGLDALEVACASPEECPFIIVSGQISEETAVSAMRAGAKDYVLKGNLARLVPAVERELREAEVRRRREEAEKALRAERERTTSILESITDAFYAVDGDWRFTYINGEGEKVLGRDWRSLKGKNVWEEFPRVIGTRLQSELQRAMTKHVPTTVDFYYDLVERWFSVRAYPSADGLSVYFHDVTERKLSEEALEAARRRAEALASIAEAGIATIELEELLDILVQRMAEALRVHSCSIWMLDEESCEFVARAGWGAPGVAGSRLRTDEGVAGLVYRDRRPICVMDAEHHPLAHDAIFKADGIKSLISVPMISRGRVVGMVCVGETQPRTFTDDEIGIMEAMAARAAQAIDNIKLYAALTRSRNALEKSLSREQHFSLLLQRALLPSEPRIGQGYNVAAEYVPAFRSREIGGDFYDVFRVGDCRAGVLIGDVAGKGLEAAAMAATTRSTIHAFVHETTSAAQALTRANSVLCSQQVDFGSFASVFLVIIDLCNHEINYSSAGHPPAMVCRPDGEVELLELGQLPLAVLDTQQFVEYHRQFEPGDRMILYTDGISEARHNSELLELEGIERTIIEHAGLPANELACAIVSAATEWAGGKLTDDAAVVVVERAE